MIDWREMIRIWDQQQEIVMAAADPLSSCYPYRPKPEALVPDRGRKTPNRQSAVPVRRDTRPGNTS